MSDVKHPGFSRLDLEQIRAILGDPEQAVVEKISRSLGLTAQRFIAHSPFLCLASSSQSGADSSPRGDNPGFVKVIDDMTLAVPDRSGNNLADTFQNILDRPQIGMLFLVPGLRETLRVNGTGYITNDEVLLRRFDIDGRQAKLAMVVDVSEVYFHCGKALIRSRLWDPSSQSLGEAATLGTNVFSAQRVEQNRVSGTSAELADALELSYRRQL